MGSKKREPSSVEESALESIELKKVNLDTDAPFAEPSKKKPKKEKIEKESEIKKTLNQNGTNAASTSTNAHKPVLNPMESKKHRKTVNKLKHKSESKKPKLLPESTSLESKNEGNESGSASNSSVGPLPEFHIGVFKDLGAADASIREAAARALVTELREVQKAYDKLENKEEVEDESKLEAEKDDGLNNCAPSVRYAVRRLIRGVSSSRESARQGFALGLTLLVAKVPSIKVDSLLKLIVNLLEVTSSMKGQEARDGLLGRLFAYGALARSGKLTEEWFSNNDTPHIKEFTSCLIALAVKKRYLQEPAVAVILEMVEKLPVDAVVNHVLDAEGLQEWFNGATESGNPDALLLAIKLREKVNVDNKIGKLLPVPYSKSALFASDHLANISSCLKESTFCQPRVHSIWSALINNLLPEIIPQDIDLTPGQNPIKKHKKSRKGTSDEQDIERNLRSLTEIIIEGSLLTSSHDRKKLAFDILLLLLPKLPISSVHVVLSYKVVQCLMDILTSKDSWLYKVAQHFLKELTSWIGDDDSKRVEVILTLQKNSNGKFDNVTRSKIVKDLMGEFKTESGCLLFVQKLTAMFLDDGQTSDEPSDQSQTTDDNNSEMGSVEDKDAFGTSEFLKTWIVESLPIVSKHLKLDQNSRFRVQKEVLKFLAVQGMFSFSLGAELTSFDLQEKIRWPKSAVSGVLGQMCIEQLQLLLASAQKGEGPHAVASGVEANDLGAYFMWFVNILCNLPSVSLSRALNGEDDEAFKKLQDMESQLSKQERNSGLSVNANKLHAMRYLLIQLLLQILLRPGDFFETATNLVICCKKAFGSSDNILESSGEEEPNEGDDAPELMDVLVDTMMSLLPQASAPLRSAIEQVFKYFCHEITDDGLLRMLRIIKKDLKPARHQNTDDMDEDEDEDEDDELLGLEDEESDEGEEETGETTADSDAQMDDSEAVVKAVNLPEGSDDESDDGMDDDTMFRMDTYLAKIFRERKNQAGGETAHSQLVLFKLRILSLLEIYLHENPGKTQVLKVFSNLAQAYANPQTTEGSEQLGQRIWGIMQKKIFKAKDYPKGENVELPVLESLLEKYLKLAAKPFKKKKSASNPSKTKQSASRTRYKMINSLAQSSTFWILKIIDARNFPGPELERVCDIFKNAIVAYFDSKKSQMKSEFLKEIFKRRPWIGRHLFEFLLEKCGNAKSQFRQVEALDLVSEILKSVVSSKDDSGNNIASKKMLKSQIPKMCNLIKYLVTNMPEKQSRRADVRKFCGKVFQILTSHGLASNFLKGLEPEGHTACEAQLGDIFVALKKQAN